MASPLLDFKKFKHIKSDAKSTTLQHKDGHTLTIAHNVLSKPHQEQLKALSKIASEAQTSSQEQESQDKYQYGKAIMKSEGGQVQENPKLEESHKTPPEQEHCMHCGGKIKMYAEGTTNVDDKNENPTMAGVRHVGEGLKNAWDTISDTASKTRAWANQEDQPSTPSAPTSAQAPNPAQDAFTYLPPNEQGVPAGLQPNATPPPEQQQPETPTQAAPTPAAEPKAAPHQANTVAPETPKFKTPEETKMGLLDEMQKHNKDYADGHINPKTYSSYFDDKSLPSKLGTLFGLALSGFGAGLTHQPNIAMEMMNKELDRDFEAQKANKTNDQNFYRIGLEQKMNEADIANKVKSGKLTDAQAQMMRTQAGIEGLALSQMTHNLSALHTQRALVDSLPPGSKQRQDAETMFAMMSQGLDAKNANIADLAASRVAMLNMGQGNTQDPEATFARQQAAYRLNGQGATADANEQHHMTVPGMPELVNQRTNRPVESKDREKIKDMTILDNKAKDVLDFIKKHKGTWNPQTRSQAEQKIEEMKVFYNNSVNGGALTQSRLGWYDEQFAKHPTDLLSQWMGSTKKLEEVADSNKTRRDTELKSYGLKPSKTSAAQGDSRATAEAWAKANPKDPRAAKILQTLGK